MAKKKGMKLIANNKIASDISALSAALSDILQTQDKYTIAYNTESISFLV